jgi:hypothetical protein
VSIALLLIVAIGAYVALSLVATLVIALILGRISEAWEAAALMTDAVAVPPPRPNLAQAEGLAIEEEAFRPESLIEPNPGWVP